MVDGVASAAGDDARLGSAYYSGRSKSRSADGCSSRLLDPTKADPLAFLKQGKGW